MISQRCEKMDINQIKYDIEELIKDFKINYEQHKKEAEANTETKLVEPLFEILGWLKSDFVKREKVRRGKKRGFADYAFKIEDKVAFFLEAKKVGIPLEKEADKQVISYALSKRVPFAVSTNFESLKIFCVEQDNALNNVFRVFKKPEEYIDNLQDLLFLHKENIEKNLHIKKAEDEGRLKKRISIDKPLLEDMMRIRNMIANDIKKRYREKYELNEREEIVQRIIDRLIFIRKCEDIGTSPEGLMLEEIMHHPWGYAHPKLRQIFSKYNDIYNGGLFAIETDNDCDKITIDGKIVQALIGLLYESKDKNYIYDFNWIDADVLGQVYEQYLGKILSQTRSGISELKNGQAHRKEQGIYYTPTYIVDYIVENTVGTLLKTRKRKPKDIKILDPACGSGSFLIKAFDCLNENLYSEDEAKYHRLDGQGMYSIKTEILKNNIYGVDLDAKAVEITKLNLMLKAAEKFRKLPDDDELHIKRGNSLIDDENIVGLDVFRWNDDFEKGSFDVVIGNPPYIDSEEMVKTQPELRKAYSTIYSTAKGNWDIFCIFIEKGLRLLKEGGYFGMIVPNKLLSAEYAIALRNFIQEHKIIAIRDYSEIPVFRANVYPIVIIIKKGSPRKNKFSAELMESYGDSAKLSFSRKIGQEDLKKIPQNTWAHIFGKHKKRIIDKVLSNSTTLDNLAKVSGAATVSEAYELKELIKELSKQRNYFKFINTGTIDRYSSSWRNSKTRYIKDSYYKPIVTKQELKNFSNKRYDEASKSKIIIAGMTKILECYLDAGQYLAGKSTTIVTSDKENLKLILAILNSRLMTFVYKNLFRSLSLQGGYMRVGPPQIRNLPIKQVPKLQQKSIIGLVDKMLYLNNRLNEIGDKKTLETVKIEEGIRKTDDEIDKIVYNIYKITKAEKDIITKT